MKNTIKEKIFFSNKRPRWAILLIDIFITFFSLALAYLIRFNFASIPQVEVDSFIYVFPGVIGLRAIGFISGRTYKGIVRYTSSRDAGRILAILTLTSFLFAIGNVITYSLTKLFWLPFSILVIEFLCTTFLMLSTRFAFKAVYFELKNPSREKRSVIIFGAGEAGVITKRTLDRDAGTKYRVLAFIDDDLKKAGKTLEGTFIYGPDKLQELLKNYNVAHVIISVNNLTTKRKQDIVETALAHNTKILNVPPVSNWINGDLSFRQIRKIQIEELLERDPIALDTENIRKENAGKIILVTGAAGSIGSELVRQLAGYSPSLLILLDQAESPLHEMELEMRDKFPELTFEVVMGDIRNKQRLENVFRTFRPDVIYHAAAYKHVPMMENNPSESILTNVLGTKYLADLAHENRVQKFVMVSTDKAVNPTNVMGASKRIAEIYTQSLGKVSQTKFITTRFGNVLGSSGSVIPRFRQQIENGGPVTITHPEITRYFMTIPEACQLVLEAGAMGKGGEIFIFDMGKSVKIVDLAKKMIKLSGLEIDKDIKIEYTGLRPGEKLYEELLNDKEKSVPTHNSQIMIAKVKEYDFESISESVNELVNLFAEQKNHQIVAKMKEIVPEYISNNSVFEALDNKDQVKEL